MAKTSKLLKKSNKIDKQNAVDTEVQDKIFVVNEEETEKRKSIIASLISESNDQSKEEVENEKSKKSEKAEDKKRKSIIDELVGGLSEVKPEEKIISPPPGPVGPKGKQGEPGIVEPLNKQAFSPKAESLLIDLFNEIVPEESRQIFINKLMNTTRTHNKEKEELARTKYTGKKSTKNDVCLIHWNGRFGNRMHTYAYAWNRAKKLGGDLYLPSEWEGDYLFKLDHKIIDDDAFRLSINQSASHFDNLSYRMEAVKKLNHKTPFNFRYVNADDPNENYNKYNQGVVIDSVCAYHHSIFDNMKLSDILELYEFSDKVKNLDIYKRLEDKQGTYDIAHLRRDDIANVNYKKNGGYSVISKDSYMKAFEKFDYNPEEIEWTSDDWSGLWGVGNGLTTGYVNQRGKWSYPTGSEVLPDIIFDWLPDFLRLYFARSIFRANSSFSFWACTLAKGRETPPRIFAPRLDHRTLYADKSTFKQETEFEFEEGNHPHWLCITGKDKCDDIIFSDEKKPSKRKASKGKRK